MKTKPYNSYLIRLYPTVSQQQDIISTVGCRRFIYNYFLDKNAAKNIQLLGLRPKNKRTLGTKGIQASVTMSNQGHLKRRL